MSLLVAEKSNLATYVSALSGVFLALCSPSGCAGVESPGFDFIN